MANRMMLVSLAFLHTAGLVAAGGSPCDIVAGTVAPAPTPAPVTTVTTTPGATVTTTPGTTVTTTPGTTVTTTPLQTCGDFACPDGWKSLPGATVCMIGKCDQSTCCSVIITTVTTTPCTTTTPGTTVTTTPGTTVTTTPAPTCGSFNCPSDMTANAGSTVCVGGKCNKATCCAAILTTVTTTPAPTAAPAPASPCGTVGPAPPAPTPAPPAPSGNPCDVQANPRLYAKESASVQDKTVAAVTPASWALPIFATMGLFAFVSLVAVARQRMNRSHRLIQPIMPTYLDEESLLEPNLED